MEFRVQTPTPRLEESRNYYTKLGFTELSKTNPILFSDGKVTIELDPSPYARPGLQLLKPSWKNLVASLQTDYPIYELDNGYLAGAPSGVWVYLIETAIGSDSTPDVATPSILGNYGGISIETIAMDTSTRFWKLLGFTNQTGAVSQGWITLTNASDVSISLMQPNSCPHRFTNPSLTYFNGKENLAIIEKIRAKGIPIAEEITFFNTEGIVDNIVLQDPGGLGCFVFNDG